MKKKHKLRYIVLIAAALILAFLLAQPLSFAPLMEDCTSLSMTYIDMTLDSDGPNMRNETYTFQSDEETFAQICDIMNRYSYHRAPLTNLTDHFPGETFPSRNRAGYSLTISFSGKDNDVQHLLLSGSSKIYVGSASYRMVRSQAIDMMEEIRQVIGAENLP